MRGKAAESEENIPINRITPAYAGKRQISWIPFVYSLGSPPPMRGKAVTIAMISCGSRITPAYAGKSALVSFFRNGSGDHPRLCGEKANFMDPVCV